MKKNAGRQRAWQVKFLRYSDVLFVLRLEALPTNLLEAAQTRPCYVVFFKAKNLRCDPNKAIVVNFPEALLF